MDADARWAMWQSWLGDDPQRGTIYAQVAEVMAFRQTWDVFSYMYREAPPEVRRERFLSHGNPDGMAEGWFDNLAGRGDYIDPRIPAADHDRLQAETRTVREWVNKAVAHLSKGRPKDGPPLQAVHDAVDVVTDLFIKYNQLILGVTIHHGVMMDYWPNASRVPWIADDSAYRVVLAKMQRQRTAAQSVRGFEPLTRDGYAVGPPESS